jgi:deoxyribose-phosphate aldolase
MNIAGYIDSTLLKPDATSQEIDNLCAEAIELGCRAVCVNLYRLDLAVRNLAGSRVSPCTVIGFPLGAVNRELKMAEIDWALAHGAREIDMVMNLGALKDRDYIRVTEEIKAASARTRNAGGLLKIIIETALLSSEEIRQACLLVREGGADFIKTSTGCRLKRW